MNELWFNLGLIWTCEIFGVTNERVMIWLMISELIKYLVYESKSANERVVI